MCPNSLFRSILRHVRLVSPISLPFLLLSPSLSLSSADPLTSHSPNSWTEMALSLLPRLATISLLSSIASPREAARIQAKRSASTPWHKNQPPTNLSPLALEDEKRTKGRVSFGAPCILKAKLNSLTKSSRRKTNSSSTGGSSKGRRWATKRKSNYSLSSGISVEMTSRVDVEEGWVDEKDGINRKGLRLGNSVVRLFLFFSLAFPLSSSLSLPLLPTPEPLLTSPSIISSSCSA